MFQPNNVIKVRITTAYQHTLRQAGVTQTCCVLAWLQGHLLSQQQPTQQSPAPLNASIIHQHSQRHGDRQHVCFYHQLALS